MTDPGEMPSTRPQHGGLVVLPIPDGPRVVVVVAGEVDLSNAASLRDRLVRSAVYGPHSVIVDATDLTFCDLRGLDALAEAVEAVKQSGACVTVRPSAQLARLLATVGQAPPQTAVSRARTRPADRPDAALRRTS